MIKFSGKKVSENISSWLVIKKPELYIVLSGESKFQQRARLGSEQENVQEKNYQDLQKRASYLSQANEGLTSFERIFFCKKKR